MPLRIRCPHCQTIAVVSDEVAGEQRLCDICNTSYTVPLPSRAIAASTAEVADVSGQCPRCRHAVAPGTAHCPRCFTVLATGQRLPLSRRLQAIGVRGWALTALATVALGSGAWLAIGAYLTHLRDARTPPAEFRPSPKIEIDPQPIAARLLAARDAEQRRAAAEELAALMPGAGAAVAAELSRSLSQPESTSRRANQLIAIELLAQASASAASPTLGKCASIPALRDESLRCRALLGDADVLPDVVRLWQMHLRRELFLARVVELAGPRGRAGVDAQIRRSQQETERFAAALRRLGQPALDRVLGESWDSWSWLGQRRGEGYGRAAFEIAMPAPARDLDVRTAVTENVRAARDALVATAANGPPAARAAAALVLKHLAPQYESARTRIISTLAALLADSSPTDQQRIVWSLSALTGREFAAVTADRHPADVNRAAVAAALEWIAAGRLAPVGPLRTRAADYSGRPRLVQRVIPARTQLEADLLHRLAGDWATARDAMDAWLASDLPYTPALARLLNPAQREPHYPALAAAMAVAAHRGDAATARSLALWSQAVDQPAWVRNLARTSDAAVAVRDRRPPGSWPADLETAAFATLDRSEPGWKPFGRAIAAGGEPLLKRLRDAEPDALPAAIRDKLLRAAEQALRTGVHVPPR